MRSKIYDKRTRRDFTVASDRKPAAVYHRESELQPDGAVPWKVGDPLNAETELDASGVFAATERCWTTTSAKRRRHSAPAPYSVRLRSRSFWEQPHERLLF